MENVQILQPDNCAFSDIKHEIVQTEDCIIDTATYPNGFVLKMTQKADSVLVQSSRPLIKISDSVYKIPD